MIVIYGISEKLNPIKAKISDVIHGCMMSVLGMPEDKPAHCWGFRGMAGAEVNDLKYKVNV